MRTEDGLVNVTCAKCGRDIVRTLPGAKVQCYQCGTWNTADSITVRQQANAESLRVSTRVKAEAGRRTNVRGGY